ncbi:MAG: hypothetical protein ACKOAU_16035 [Pirellula sp.]
MGWNVSETKASFKHGALELVVHMLPTLRIEIDQPSGKFAWEIQPREDSVMATEKPPKPSESYARLNDFIISFPQKYPWPFSYQLDVRVQPSDTHLLVAELWLSVQTSMLECNPQLILLPSNDKGPWTCHPEFLCSGDRRTSLAIHPLDRSDSKLHTSRSGSIERLDLFGRFMEKGVIRRGRLLLVASNSSISEKQMMEFCKAFADSQLPLTA